MVYLVIMRKGNPFSKKEWLVSGGTLILLAMIQVAIGAAPLMFWIPGMIVAVTVMYGFFILCGKSNRITAGYWLVRAFVLAEMMASLEWQISYFITENLITATRGV